jgi:hypothetical protein
MSARPLPTFPVALAAALLCVQVLACANSVPQGDTTRDDNSRAGADVRPIGDNDEEPRDTGRRDAVSDSVSTDDPPETGVGDAEGDLSLSQDADNDTQPSADTGASDGGECRGQGCACTPITAASICVGGPCIDGFCCDSACSSTCQSCAVPGREGTCSFTPAGVDPDNDCESSATASCGTSGACDGAGACARYGSETACNDGQTCSTNDRCDGEGRCIGTVAATCGPGPDNECCVGTCADGVGCQTLAGSCADSCGENVLQLGGTCAGCGAPGAEGICQGGTSFRCDASNRNLCQQISCGGTPYQCTNQGGVWAWRPGGSCDDGDACTHSDSCSAGTCAGTAIACTGTACTDSVCNGTASCTVTPRVGRACDDGNACTFNDTCNASGVCQAGSETTCTSTPCIARTCNGAGGCTETIRAGAACEDGDLCTWADSCDASGTCQRGTPITCSGLDTTCAAYTCNGTSSCAATPRNVGLTCDDANAATDLDVCRADGTCQGDAGCPPPAEACLAGTQNRDGCTNARTISRTVAGAGGFVANDTTCSARDRFDDSSGCWDANNDHTYRLYMRQGESASVRLQTLTACIGGSWQGTLKIFENTGCSDTACGAKVYCDYNETNQITTYTAPRDGWVIIVADGSSAFDDEGTYRLTVTLSCRTGNCACL